MAVRLKIKEIAEGKGISQGKLSRVADVSINTIRRIFDDPYYSITTHTLGKIAAALSVATKDLIEDT